MAKPQILQRLKPGKFVWPGLFPFFAATWNWLLDSWDNLRGDFDENPKLGAITVDRTNPDRPVIRLRTDNLKLGGGGSELVKGDDTNITFTETTDGKIAVNVYYT